MVIAYKLKGGKIAFTQQDEFDFVNSGVCALREDSDGYHWVVEEPLVIEVLEEELRASEFDPEVLAYLDQFNTILTNLGTNSVAKGRHLNCWCIDPCSTLMAKFLWIYLSSRISKIFQNGAKLQH